MLNCLKGKEAKILLAVALAGIALGLKTTALAQTPVATPMSASCRTGGTTSDSVVLGPGDLVHIVVFDIPELEQRLTVTDGGDVNASLLGNVHVAGLSANAAAKLIEHMMIDRSFLARPNVVNLSIEQTATMQVSVLGEVHTPGTYEIGTSRNILDIITLAGGFTGAADRYVTVKHKGETGGGTVVYLPNNPQVAIANAGAVCPGDTVLVPQAGLIYVLGDVNKPGAYYMTRDSTLSALQAVSLAGGLLPNAAAPSSKIVRRTTMNPQGYVDIKLQLRAIQNGKQADVQLQANDVIYVPFSYVRNFAIGSSAIIASATSALIYTH